MIVTLAELCEIRKNHSNHNIIFAGGVFDLMHPGHLDLFKRMKKSADIVVAVSSDTRVKQRKGIFRPIHDQYTCLEIVDSVKNVNYCLIAPDPDGGTDVPTVKILRMLYPNIFMTCDKSWLQYNDIFEE